MSNLVPVVVEQTSRGERSFDSYSAGTPGKRYVLPHSTVLLHQPHGGAQGQSVDIDLQAREILRLRALVDRILARHTGQDVERITRDTDRDFIMTAEQALEYGLADEELSSRRVVSELASATSRG